ncbi:uncharacterized protein TRUGW13939_10081 [Talaromyces rugulosus]|uniref:C2 domain-containing protein n=1 Tax=Talaromyces rugulosus TaxID=121627 RepID=A0A7H8REF5_TALRU|nr:uncharacterized protein TRUGW13939_10081 [Talaromyces rugulosus]QKX62913.1 hypothetical protein TRUGW13939_10081 [Talaromyces rugulosus]
MASKPMKMPTSHGHTAGIYADMSVDGPRIGTLVVIFDRAKNLPNRKTMGKQNPYVAARLGKEAKKTETDMRGGQTPRWDQELRFTVHDSPDYNQIKISVFNDDKKTELIGETWVDLNALIIPGGSQSDTWHELKFKGKYAGDIRMEMTYYDTRPEDETVIERRTVVTDKPQPKASSVPQGGPSSLSGPRQPRPVKRRPLPDDPTGASVPRPAPVQEYIPPAPAPAPAPQQTSLPPRSARDYVQPLATVEQVQPSQFSEMQHPRAHDGSYETYYPDNNIVSSQEQHANSYYQPHPEPHHAYNEHRDNPPADYHQQRRQPISDSHAYSYDVDTRGNAPYEAIEQHSRHLPQQSSYTNPLDGCYSHDPAPYPPGSRGSPNPPNSYAVVPHSGVPVEPMVNHPTSVTPIRHGMHGQSPSRQMMASEEERPFYAAMQPTVEDENDEGPPPPPPVHRSSVGPAVQRPVASPSSYKPYSHEYSQRAESRSPHAPPAAYPTDPDFSHSLSKSPSQGHVRGYLPEAYDSPVPSSLIAGYDSASMAVELSRPTYPDNRVSRVPTGAPPQSDIAYIHENTHAQNSVQPLRSSPAPVDQSIVRAQSGSVSPSPRPLSYRKSVSPRPPSRDNREIAGVPFSPDSFDALNPRRSPSATRESRPRYETPDREMEITKQADVGADDGPIIGDDGRIIDPSDHLPSETWAPEPEKKTKKPEVIIRFKHNPQNASHSARSSPREHHHSASVTPESTHRHTIRPWSYKPNGSQQPRQHHEHPSPTTYTPPRPGSQGRDYDRHDSYSHQRNQSTQATYSTPPRHRSVSPNPNPQTSPLYSYGSSGPPIPAKVPIATPVANNGYNRGSGMDALSQELQSIDIGSGGYEPVRAVRRYAPRLPATTSGGYR